MVMIYLDLILILLLIFDNDFFVRQLLDWICQIDTQAQSPMKIYQHLYQNCYWNRYPNSSKFLNYISGTTCTDPGYPKGGYLTAQSFERDSVVTFGCNLAGFTVPSDSVLKCILNGAANGVVWNGTTPAECTGMHNQLKGGKLATLKLLLLPVMCRFSLQMIQITKGRCRKLLQKMLFPCLVYFTAKSRGRNDWMRFHFAPTACNLTHLHIHWFSFIIYNIL